MYDKIYVVTSIFIILALLFIIFALYVCSDDEIKRVQEEKQTLEYQIKLKEQNVWEKSKTSDNLESFDLLIR